MLGLVFTEFTGMVEARFGADVLDEILDASGNRHDGAYTAVGDYDHAELVAMVAALSAHTGVPVTELVRAFGGHLMTVFVRDYRRFFETHDNLFDFLHSIDGLVHREVKKLYDAARPPRLVAESIDDTSIRLSYSSHRSMGDLAIGLLEGAAGHYGESVEIERQPAPGGEVFVLSRTHAA